jgi:hypothetical protein
MEANNRSILHHQMGVAIETVTGCKLRVSRHLGSAFDMCQTGLRNHSCYFVLFDSDREG